jgi:hypothetical protein
LATLNHLSSAEKERLERGLTRLEEWSSKILVPFQARHLKNSQALWINRRWFLEREIDVDNEDTRRRIHRWLVEEFAYVAPEPGDPPDAFTNTFRTLHADRYGSSTGRTMHGGSGRVATIGSFQTKGVGITPLAGAGADWGHSHGCCSLEEAIREAIFSEVAAAEFPHGALPVVAVLATDLYFSDPPVRRGIVVRPSALRIAHAERAPLFRESLTGFSNFQRDDVSRSRDVVQRWSKSSATDLAELVRRIAEQVAFGQVHRMFSGGYFSSNLTVDGAVMDYGGMRALPDWVNARNLDGVVGFGDEMKIVGKLIESISFFFAKYLPKHAHKPPSGAVLRAVAHEAHARAFGRECLRIWNVDPSASASLNSAIMQALNRYFALQQRHRVNYKHGVTERFPWLHDGNSLDIAESSGTLRDIVAALRQHFAGFPDRAERLRRASLTACRYLMPRSEMNRETLKARIESSIAAPRRTDGQCNWLEEFMKSTISRGRRHWPNLPEDLTVCAHVAFDGSSALLCEEQELRKVYWFEGPRVGDRLVLFDSELPIDRGIEIGAQVMGHRWTARVAVSDCESLAQLRVPEMTTSYSCSSSAW